MSGAVARYSAGDYFAPLGDEIFQNANVLIVDAGGVLSTKTADLAAVKWFPFLSATRIHGYFSCLYINYGELIHAITD
jgi:hypothetical protein